MVVIPAQRRLWYDELYTYYIAHAPTLQALIHQTRSIDLNPPLIYLVTRASEQMLGDTLFAARLPSMLAFLGGSFLLFAYLRRKVAPIWAAAAVLSFWCTKYFLYATEVRPYGLLFFFTCLAVYSLDLARTKSTRHLYLSGILIGVAGVLCCHVFGPFSVLPLFISEAARTLKRRKVDWAIWAMLLVPISLVLLYLPMVRHAGGGLFPASLQAGYRKILMFYPKVFSSLFTPLLGATAAIVFARRRNGGGSTPFRFRVAGIAIEDVAMAAAFLMPPILINLISLRSHGSFFERYCITSAVAICSITILLLGYAVRFQYVPGLLTFVMLAAAGLYNNIVPPLVNMLAPQTAKQSITEVMPQLPFVVANGLTFLELDHYEQAEFLKRVYYLTDHEGVVRYAHANFFEDLQELKQVFPIRANVAQFAEFSETHDHFLLLADTSVPEAWLYFKLKAEGASVVELGKFRSPYKDKTVYEIRLPVKKTISLLR